MWTKEVATNVSIEISFIVMHYCVSLAIWYRKGCISRTFWPFGVSIWNCLYPPSSKEPCLIRFLIFRLYVHQSTSKLHIQKKLTGTSKDHWLHHLWCPFSGNENGCSEGKGTCASFRLVPDQNDQVTGIPEACWYLSPVSFSTAEAIQ